MQWFFGTRALKRKHTINKKKDRYGYCCNVYDRAIDPKAPVITVRDADYPWDGSVRRHRTSLFNRSASKERIDHSHLSTFDPHDMQVNAPLAMRK
mgnify:CR=1 FL=1